MEYLTVKEVAELKGCTERYIQRLVKSEKMDSIEKINPSNQQTCYMIPVTSLSDELKSRYYERKRAGSGLLPAVKESKKAKSKKPRPQRSFEELSDDERREITVWTGILNEWQGMRAGYSSKTEFDKLYVGKCQLEHPDMKISVDILYRKLRAYKDNDLEGLIDKRGAWNRGSSTIPEEVWNAFLWYWLDDKKPTVSLSYRSTVSWTEEFHPELVPAIPAEQAFRRKIDNDVKYALKTYMRDGEKAFHDRCMPYIMRMYDKLEANDVSIIDKLDPSVKETVDEMIKTGAYYREIVDYIRSNGISVSMAAVGRYAKNLMSTLDALRMSQANFKAIMEETEKYPDLDVTEGILRLLSSQMLGAINKMPEEQLETLDFETLSKNAIALTRAAAYKKQIDIKNKALLENGADQFMSYIFETMAAEEPDLYKKLRKYVKSKQEAG